MSPCVPDDFTMPPGMHFHLLLVNCYPQGLPSSANGSSILLTTQVTTLGLACTLGFCCSTSNSSESDQVHLTLLSPALVGSHPTGCSQHNHQWPYVFCSNLTMGPQLGLPKKDLSPSCLYFLTSLLSSLHSGSNCSLLTHEHSESSPRASCLNGTPIPPYSLSNCFSVPTVPPATTWSHIFRPCSLVPQGRHKGPGA